MSSPEMEERSASAPEGQKAQKRQRVMRKRIRRHDRLLTLVLLILILLFNILGLVMKDTGFSDTENRAMAQKPEIHVSGLLDGSAEADIEDWFADQFAGRAAFVRFKTRLDRLLGKREISGVYIGKDGYLMEEPASPDPEWFSRNLEAIRDFASRHQELDLYMSVIPNAAAVLSGYLPSQAPVRDQAVDMAAIQAALPENVRFLDMTEALKAHQDEGIYYRTDHHWTSLGARYAFEAMAPEMGITGVSSDYTVYTVADDFTGTMASKAAVYDSTDMVQLYVPGNVKNDYVVAYPGTEGESCSMYKSEALNARDKYTVFFGGNYSMVDIKTVTNNHRCLLLIKDSYANCFVQFLTPYYEHIIMIDPRYYYDDLEQVISSQTVTDVLFLYNMNTYLEDRSLADTLAAPEPGQEAETQASGQALTEESQGSGQETEGEEQASGQEASEEEQTYSLEMETEEQADDAFMGDAEMTGDTFENGI